MQKANAAFIVFFGIISFTTACRKKENPTNNTSTTASFTGCRIAQITEYQVDTTRSTIYTFSYNSDGTVSQIKFTSYPEPSDQFIRNITYRDNYVIVYTTDNGSANTKDSLVLNAQKQVTYIDHHDYNGSPPPNVNWEQYQYDSMGNVISVLYHNYNTVTSTVLQWQNGDLQWNTSFNDYESYVYTGIPRNTGNIKTGINDFITYGRSIFTTQHLHSMVIAAGTDTTNYVYILDSAGKLTHIKAIEPGNYVYNTSITYTCE